MTALKRDQTPIKAIIFDLGNVLIHFDAYKAAKRLAKECRIPLIKIWMHFFTSKSERDYTCGKITSHVFYRQVKKALKTDIPYKVFRSYWNDIFWENEGMDEILTNLKKKYPLYLISNTNAMHFNHIRNNYSILRHFKKTFPSHLMGHRKPDKQIYRKVLKRIRFKPEETVFIDDIPEFVQGARSVGMNAIRFRSQKKMLEDLRRLGVEA